MSIKVFKKYRKYQKGVDRASPNKIVRTIAYLANEPRSIEKVFLQDGIVATNAYLANE